MRKYSLVFIVITLLITTAFKYYSDGIDYDNPKEDDIPQLIRNLEIDYYNLGEHEELIKRKYVISINALAKLGDKAIPALIEALKHENCNVRSGAADALGDIGTDSDEVIYALLEMLWNEDEEDGDNIAAAYALCRLHPGVKKVIPSIIIKLDDPDPIIRRRAAFTLYNLGPDAEPGIEKLIGVLNDEDINVQGMALAALRKQGPAAKDAVPALISILEDTNTNLVGAAMAVLASIGPAAVDAIPVLIANMENEKSGYRENIAKALGGISSDPERSIPALIVLLEDEDWWVRMVAARALTQFGPSAKDAVPALTKALKDEYFFVASYAADALGNIGCEPNVVSALANALEDKGFKLRFWAAIALGKLAPDAVEAIPVLIQALSDEDFTVRHYASEALGKFGPVAEEAIPELRKTLNDEDFEKRITAASAIILITPEADDAILTLMNEAGSNESWYARWKVVTGLGDAGANAYNALPVLRQLLNDEDGRVGVGAALAIAKITQDPTEAVILLIGFLDDDNTGARIYAANALGEIGPPAAPALDKLEYMTVNDPSFDRLTGKATVRIAAREAIEKIAVTE